MSNADWATVVGSLSGSVVDRGVIYTRDPPNGGGSFVYAFHSVADGAGIAALRTDVFQFNPALSGTTIRGALKRGVTFINGGFAPFLFCALQTDSVAANGYLLGIADAEPGHLVLRKGAMSVGLPDVAPGSQGVLRRSVETFAHGAWLHLRLDAEVQAGGNVLIRVRRNRLDETPLGFPPAWEAIDGMDDYTDVAVGAYANGYAGFGFKLESSARKHAYVDHVEIFAQR